MTLEIEYTSISMVADCFKNRKKGELELDRNPSGKLEGDGIKIWVVKFFPNAEDFESRLFLRTHLDGF